MFDRLDHVVRRLCIFVAVAGGLGLLAATLVTCISIALKLARRAMEAIGFTPDNLSWVRPILGEEELVQYAVGLALFAALPYVMYARGHITVDLFQKRFGVRLNQVLDLVGDVSLLVLAWLMFSRQWTLLFKPARRDDPPWVEAFLARDWAE
ncbi:MAG: TRAP transporter small permease subunit [Pseudomonadota bacterium]